MSRSTLTDPCSQSFMPHWHLLLRLPWHDSGWEGKVCARPDRQVECLVNPKYSNQFDIGVERENADKRWIPMVTRGKSANPNAGMRLYRLPCWEAVNLFGRQQLSYRPPVHSNIYVDGRLQLKFARQDWELPAGAFVFAPYKHMLRYGVQATNAHPGKPWLSVPEDELPVLDAFWKRIVPRQSVVYFYVDGHHPWSAICPRLPIGMSIVTSVSDQAFHGARATPQGAYPVWQRWIEHGWPDGGFRIPWHALDDKTARAVAEEAAEHVPKTPRYSQETADHTVMARFAQALLRAGKKLAGLEKADTGNLSWLNSQVEVLENSRELRPSLEYLFDYLGCQDPRGLAADLETAGAMLNVDPASILLDTTPGPLPHYIDMNCLGDMAQKLKGQSKLRQKWMILLTQFKLMGREHFASLAESKGLRRRGIRASMADLLANPFLLVESDKGLPLKLSITRGQRLSLKDTMADAEPSQLAASHLWDAKSEDVHSPSVELYDKVRHQSERHQATTIDATGCGAELRDWSDAKLGTETNRRVGPNLHLERLDGGIIASLSEFREMEARVAARLQSIQDAAARHAAHPLTRGCEQFMARRGVLVLCGPAGSGKSTNLIESFKREEVRDLWGQTAILAPTGRAISILAGYFEIANLSGVLAKQGQLCTIHSFLHQNERLSAERRNTAPKSSLNTLVLDESSMIDLELLDALLEAVDLRSLRRIIFMGDDGQLPPVGIGKPFIDILRWLQERAPDDVLTKEGVRCDGEGTVLLLEQLRAPAATVGELFAGITKESGSNSLSDVAVSHWSIQEELLTTLFVKSLEPHKFSHDVSGHHMISIQHGRIGGVSHLNRWGAYFDGKDKYGYRAEVSGAGARCGDKVVQLHNARLYSPTTKQTHLVTNGMLGRVKWVQLEKGAPRKGEPGNKKARPGVWVEFPDLNGATIGYSLKQAKRLLDLGYATTVHKAQGSTFSHVTAVIPWSARPIDRELLYTAFTRHSHTLTVLLHKPEYVSEADFSSRAIVSGTERRTTNLFRLLMESSHWPIQE